LQSSFATDSMGRRTLKSAPDRQKTDQGRD
jgi:hypothetical protein